MPLISLKNVTLSYDNANVLEDLSFNLQGGEYLCVVGENGSGKSTLIKALLSLKSVKSGEIIYDKNLKRNEIGYLPQQTGAQKDFPASVYEVVLSGCLAKRCWRPFYSKRERETALKNMEKLDITDLKNKSYRELSGGQQQRVLLARALCAACRLILLDEPVSGLDPLMTVELYCLIRKINDEGMTVIMVSHDIECAVSHATHILHLQNKPLFFGPVEDYKNSEIGKRFLMCDHSH